MDGMTAIPSQEGRTASQTAHGSKGCLVDGCPCKDARIISTRRVAFYSEWARQHEETADRQIEPDPEWADLFRPWRGRLTDEHGRYSPRRASAGPTYAGRPGS